MSERACARDSPVPAVSADTMVGCDEADTRSARNAQHPTTAANRLNPATTAMARCHRVGSPRPRKLTVRPLYQRPEVTAVIQPGKTISGMAISAAVAAP